MSRPLKKGGAENAKRIFLANPNDFGTNLFDTF